MRRKIRNLVTKKRERVFSDVNCPTQQKTYCNTYHKIDKGNWMEYKYDISTESHLHGWGPKLAARFSISILIMPTKCTAFFSRSTILEESQWN
jgi:hypothetical protein